MTAVAIGTRLGTICDRRCIQNIAACRLWSLNPKPSESTTTPCHGGPYCLDYVFAGALEMQSNDGAGSKIELRGIVLPVVFSPWVLEQNDAGLGRSYPQRRSPHGIERDVFACIESHQALAPAPVWCDPRADARGPGRATHRISSCPLLALFASTSRMSHGMEPSCVELSVEPVTQRARSAGPHSWEGSWRPVFNPAEELVVGPE